MNILRSCPREYFPFSRMSLQLLWFPGLSQFVHLKLKYYRTLPVVFFLGKEEVGPLTCSKFHKKVARIICSLVHPMWILCGFLDFQKP